MRAGPDIPLQASAGPRLRRRETLLAGGAGVAATAIAMAGCGSDDEATTTAEEGDSGTAALDGLLLLERRADGVFRQGTRFSQGRTRRLMRLLGEQAIAHIQAIEPLIRAEGGIVPAGGREAGDAFIRDGDSAVRAALAITDEQLAAYAAAIGELPRSLRREITTIFANNAQHLILLGSLPQASAAPGLERG